MKKTLGAVALLVAAGLTLAGCGNGGDTSNDSHANGSASMPGMSSHDRQDIDFAKAMVPHHQQAVVMARMAKQHAGSAAVKQLAAQIQAAQGPEIMTMRGWLKRWGASAGAMHGMAGMHRSMNKPGMMSAADMHRLHSVAGTQFDQMFLRGMITHHQGAVRMANTEIGEGKNPQVIALAKKIRAAQTREINRMRQMLHS